MSMMKQAKQYRRIEYARWKTDEEIMKTTRATESGTKVNTCRRVNNSILVNITLLRNLKPTTKDKLINDAIKFLQSASTSLAAYTNPTVYPTKRYPKA